MKKLIVGVVLVGLLFAPLSVVRAQTPPGEAELRALLVQIIDLLQQQIAALVAQIAAQNMVITTQSETISNQQGQIQNTGNLGGQGDPGPTTSAAAPAEPIVNVSVRQENTNRNGDALEPGRHAVVVDVTGDWNASRLWMWRPDGTQSAGFGFTDTRQYWMPLTDTQTGEYPWEVTVIKCDNPTTLGVSCINSEISRKTVSGVFVVE